MAKVNVLFVCTGNVFRSVAAEYCLKKYLKDNNILRFNVSSAGIEAKPEPMDVAIIKTLNSLGIDVSHHKQRKLSKKIVHENDIIISMSNEHYDFILKKFGIASFYFNELSIGKKKGIKDIWQAVPDLKSNPNAAVNYSAKVVRYIWDKTPKIAEELVTRNFLFEDFVNNKTAHKNGFRFIPVYESTHSIVFSSFSIPEFADNHLLVIPKKRYPYLEQIPQPVLNDLMRTISLMGRFVMTKYPAYNILLNNGSQAGQNIFHVHFHIIPRREDDGIVLYNFVRKQVSKKEFEEHNIQLKEEIQEFLSHI